MNAEEALKRQIEAYRQMTGQRRLEIALDLHEMACNIARAAIKQQFPDADGEDVERHLRERLKIDCDYLQQFVVDHFCVETLEEFLQSEFHPKGPADGSAV